MEEQDKFLGATDIDPEIAKLLAEGMLQLLSGLAVVTGDVEAFGKHEMRKKGFH